MEEIIYRRYSRLLNENKSLPKLIVIELNGTILPPINWPNQKLENGDRLEIVTIVGGGSYN